MAVSAVHVFQVLKDDFYCQCREGEARARHISTTSSFYQYIHQDQDTPDKQQVRARLNNDGLLCTHAAHCARL